MSRETVALGREMHRSRKKRKGAERVLDNPPASSGVVSANGASRVRPDASAYVLDVATIHPELTESGVAVLASRVVDLEWRAA
jgi:hypothetical protein